MTETEDKIEHKELSISPTDVEKKPSKIPLYVAILSILLLVASAFVAFYIYQQNQRLVTSHQEQLNALSEKLSAHSSEQNEQLNKSVAIKTALEAKVEQVTRQLKQANNDTQIVKTDIQSLQRSFAETTIRHPNDWILAEVEYLVALAGRKIWLEKDIKTAIALLVAADQRIVELNDASLSPLRGAILEDVNTLEALPKQDADGVILALSGLERRIDGLRSNSLTFTEKSVTESVEVSTDINDWHDNLGKSWNAFVESFITVNKRENKIEALLSPEQSWYLKEHLRNNLAKAEFAVYREQQGVYDIALENILSLLNNYYDLKDSNTGHFHKSIQRLSKRQVTIKYPDQLKSAPLLERVIEQRLQKSLVSSTLK